MMCPHCGDSELRLTQESWRKLVEKNTERISKYYTCDKCGCNLYWRAYLEEDFERKKHKRQH